MRRTQVDGGVTISLDGQHEAFQRQIDSLEEEIESFEAAYARDLGAVVQALSRAEFLRDGAQQAMIAYETAATSADGAATELRATIARKESRETGWGLGAEPLPYYLMAAQRSQLKELESRAREAAERLAAVRQRWAEVSNEAALMRGCLDQLRRERDVKLDALRRLRRDLLSGTVQPAPEILRVAAITTPRFDERWEIPITGGGSASSGRECQRCGDPVPRGRKRFCTRECRQLYVEENGTVEHPKRSRFYDYGSADPEDELWDEPPTT